MWSLVSRAQCESSSKGLGLSLEAKVMARDQDQDLIQWQGYGKYMHTAIFKSGLCIVDIVQCSFHLCYAGCSWALLMF